MLIWLGARILSMKLCNFLKIGILTYIRGLNMAANVATLGAKARIFLARPLPWAISWWLRLGHYEMLLTRFLMLEICIQIWWGGAELRKEFWQKNYDGARQPHVAKPPINMMTLSRACSPKLCKSLATRFFTSF